MSNGENRWWFCFELPSDEMSNAKLIALQVTILVVVAVVSLLFGLGRGYFLGAAAATLAIYGPVLVDRYARRD